MRFARLQARLSFEMARSFRAIWGFLIVLAVLALLWQGWFPDLRRSGDNHARAFLAALLAGALAIKISARVSVAERRRSLMRETLSDVELGLLLLASTYVFLSVVGGVTSPIYPLVYALVSFLVTFHPLRTGIPLAVAALVFEAAMTFGPGASPSAVALFPGHAGFILVFAALNVAFLHAEVARQRREHKRLLQEEITSMREEARDFRLISPALRPESRLRTRAEEEEKLSQGSIETIRQQLLYTVRLLHQSLSLGTCAILWLDATGERLKWKEVVTATTAIKEGPLSAKAGLFAAALREERPCMVDGPNATLISYYESPQDVVAVGCVPIHEGRTVRGILLCDRHAGSAFTATEVELMASAVVQIMRIVQSERVFQAVERSKHEYERLNRASSALNRALTLDEVYDAAIEGASGVCEFDLAIISTQEKQVHQIRRVVGEGMEALVGTMHSDPTSLVAMVTKNKLALPANAEWHKDTLLFSPEARIRGCESVYVLPLLVKDEVIGTFTLAARRAGAFPRDRREMLGVVANQVAISLQNACMVQSLEEQATTDGLTALINHRTFQERFSSMLTRAERHSFRVALILTDIDHFKKVNDTYGHPTGDAVLKRVAAILKASARKIDIVARYGGEEFALVLEGTDKEGAKQLAERIRNEVAAQGFESSQGSFKATLSLGVAVYPDDGAKKQEIISGADKALYSAKREGRNRTVCHGGAIRGEPALRALAG